MTPGPPAAPPRRRSPASHAGWPGAGAPCPARRGPVRWLRRRRAGPSAEPAGQRSRRAPPLHRPPGSPRAGAGCTRHAALVNTSSVGACSTTRPDAHHQDVVGDLPDHRQVMADEQVGQAQSGLQVGEQFEYLRLHHHVERRHRLVAHQHLGPQRQRPRDRDPLALTAGQLARAAGPAPTTAAPPRRAVRGPRARARSRSPTPWIRNGSSMARNTEYMGSRLLYGFWNTGCDSAAERQRPAAVQRPRRRCRRTSRCPRWAPAVRAPSAPRSTCPNPIHRRPPCVRARRTPERHAVDGGELARAATGTAPATRYTLVSAGCDHEIVGAGGSPRNRPGAQRRRQRRRRGHQPPGVLVLRIAQDRLCRTGFHHGSRDT